MKNSFFVFVGIVFIFFGCSTEKNTRVNRFYHNTTAYYNGYFNAREIIKEQNKEFAKNRKEDYAKILPVNRYPNEEESKGFFPPMDRSIEKTSKVISKHAMPREKLAKYARTEYGKWMDENWLVMGEAHFYKREYSQAIEKFKYVIKMYPKSPSKYVAKLWLAKTHIEMENFLEAIKYLNEITNEKEAKRLKEERKKEKQERRSKYKKKKRGKKSKVKVYKDREKKREEKSVLVTFPEHLTDDLEATYADYYIRKGEFKEGLAHLDSAISVVKSKKLRVRYKFIAAQLYQEEGKKAKAYELYSYVIKKNAPYRMIFYSKINRALIANSSDRGGLKKELLKLAKDSKYDEFKDQIYYALAEIELQEKHRNKGIEYLLKSASFPSSSVTQKGKTYIKLADLYFDDKLYVVAQKYYDSSLTSLPNTYPNYLAIKDKSESLTDLVRYFNNVKLQDSLQEIALLTDKQRLDKIEEILYNKKITEQENKEKKKREANKANAIVPITADKGKFWMYNPQSKGFGFNEFKSIWGDIPLEDNWRRKNKNKFSGTSEETDTDGAPIVTDKEIQDFASKLPVSSNMLKKSNITIINSLYLAGLIYKDKFNDLREATNSFNEVKKRFHPNDKAVPSMYQLYKCYIDKGQQDLANDIKEQIIETYPNSQEAKILLDPGYSSSLKSASEKSKTDYQEVYKLIENNENNLAIQKINSILNNSKTNEFECKLKYLKAKAYGSMQQIDSLEGALEDVVRTCPSKKVGLLAKTALSQLKKTNVKKQKKEKEMFSFDENAEHFFVALVPNGKNDMNKIKLAFSNFNASSFGAKKLKVSTTFLDIKTQTVLVKSFKNKKEAQSYYVAYKVNNNELKEFNTKFDYYIISAKNFSALFIGKDIEKYKEFYGKHYVTK